MIPLERVSLNGQVAGRNCSRAVRSMAIVISRHLLHSSFEFILDKESVVGGKGKFADNMHERGQI
jgi:hypothetical protein